VFFVWLLIANLCCLLWSDSFFVSDITVFGIVMTKRDRKFWVNKKPKQPEKVTHETGKKPMDFNCEYLVD
jgi:hypothetical protein